MPIQDGDDLREFKCKECGHVVVVNPDIPLDITPTVCMQCWPRVAKEQERRMIKLCEDTASFAKMLR